MAGVAIGVVLLGYGEWLLWQRNKRDQEAEAATLTTRLNAVVDEFSEQTERCQGIEMQQDQNIRALQTRVLALEDKAKLVANAPATPRARAATSPAGEVRWWCYRGRECFRDRSDCIAGDDARQTECLPRQQAWCGGKSAADCFGAMQDCIEIESKIAADKQLGGNGPDPVPCDEIE